MALYLGRQLLKTLAGTPAWGAARRAYGKIRASLGEPALAYLERLSGFFHPTTVGIGGSARRV